MKSVRKFLRAQFSGFVFRRVQDVVIYNVSETLCPTLVFTPTEDPTKEVSHESFGPFTDEQYEKNVEYRCKKFVAVTSTRPIRAESSETCRRTIRCPSENYAEIDMTGSFWFVKKDQAYEVPPRKDDLVCGLVSNEGLEYSFWFTCSEQFLRAWTLIMFKKHSTFFEKDEEKLYRWVMSGNRLCTNSYLKWRLALETTENGQKKPPAEEVNKRFYHLRTESASKDWVHIYAALVLVARFNKLPTKDNVPINLDGGPVMQNWHIPPDFVSNLLKTSG